MRLTFLLTIAVATMASGCSKKITVESDTCWDGYLNDGSVQGCGNQAYSLKGDPSCFTFQKKTDYGFLSIRVKAGSGDEPSTTAAYGVVSGCVR